MIKRTGPHPISVHLGMAAASATNMQLYSSSFEVQKDNTKLIEMMRGIQMYQNASHIAFRNDMECIWSRKGAKILQRVSQANAAPLIIIPSLVNRSYIFNLNAQRSFVDWVAGNGRQVYLLDWGDFASGDCATMAEIVFNIIPECIRFVSLRHGGLKPDILAYCIGGALTLGAVQCLTTEVNKIVLLASPWNFHHNKLELSNRVRSWSPFALSAILEKGYLPEQWIQALFASLDPDTTIHKFIKFAAMDKSSQRANLFIDVEDWLNDNVKMSSEIANHCLQNWFACNVLIKNEWYVDGKHINFSNITNRVLIIASKKDRLVPFESAVDVEFTLKNASCQTHEAFCGHIGFIAGSDAVQSVWVPLLNWLKEK